MIVAIINEIDCYENLLKVRRHFLEIAEERNRNNSSYKLELQILSYS